jgi:hypothetical protein
MEVFGVVLHLIGSLQYQLNAIFRTSNTLECILFEWLAATVGLNATKSAFLNFTPTVTSSTELSFSSNAIKSGLTRELVLSG